MGDKERIAKLERDVETLTLALRMAWAKIIGGNAMMMFERELWDARLVMAQLTPVAEAPSEPGPC